MQINKKFVTAMLVFLTGTGIIICAIGVAYLCIIKFQTNNQAGLLKSLAIIGVVILLSWIAYIGQKISSGINFFKIHSENLNKQFENLNNSFLNFNSSIDKFNQNLRVEINKLHTDFNDINKGLSIEISNLRDDLNMWLNSINKDMNTGVNFLRKDIIIANNSLGDDLKKEIVELNKNLAKIQSVIELLQSLNDDFGQMNCDSKDVNQNICQIKEFFEQIENHLDFKK